MYAWRPRAGDQEEEKSREAAAEERRRASATGALSDLGHLGPCDQAGVIFSRPGHTGHTGRQQAGYHDHILTLTAAEGWLPSTPAHCVPGNVIGALLRTSMGLGCVLPASTCTGRISSQQDTTSNGKSVHVLWVAGVGSGGGTLGGTGGFLFFDANDPSDQKKKRKSAAATETDTPEKSKDKGPPKRSPKK